MSVIAAPGRHPACLGTPTPLQRVARKSSSIAASVILSAILICAVYLASHYRHEIVASFQASNLAAVRYQAVGMLSVP